tara:strand:+ start:2477 stop:2734 length:258 start_codon:yes stop_codon:yes gene_type:complete
MDWKERGVCMAFNKYTQLNFKGQKMPDYIYDLHKLKNHEIKLFKKCARINCDNDISTSRKKHQSFICVDCMIYLTRYQKCITKYF